MDDKLLKPEDAAKALGVALSTLKRWRSEGRGPKWVRYGPRTIRYQLNPNDCSEPGQLSSGDAP